MKTKTLLPLAAALAGSLFAALPAHAVPGTSDTVLFFGTPFTIPEGTGSAPESTITLGTGPVGAIGYVSLLESPTAGNVPPNVSDYLWLENGVFFFASDGDPGGFPAVPFDAAVAGAPLASIPETGTFQDLSPFFGLTPSSILVMSDVSATPEPSTLALFGLGGAALVNCLRRRKA
jgi:hypothetical protein